MREERGNAHPRSPRSSVFPHIALEKCSAKIPQIDVSQIRYSIAVWCQPWLKHLRSTLSVHAHPSLRQSRSPVVCSVFPSSYKTVRDSFKARLALLDAVPVLYYNEISSGCPGSALRPESQHVRIDHYVHQPRLHIFRRALVPVATQTIKSTRLVVILMMTGLVLSRTASFKLGRHNWGTRATFPGESYTHARVSPSYYYSDHDSHNLALGSIVVVRSFCRGRSTSRYPCMSS